MSLPLVRVPGSLIKEWKSIVCLTLMSVVKLMFLSTRETLSDSLAGWTLKHIFVCTKFKQSVLLVPVDKDVTSKFCTKATVSVCYYVAQSATLLP